MDIIVFYFCHRYDDKIVIAFQKRCYTAETIHDEAWTLVVLNQRDQCD